MQDKSITDVITVTAKLYDVQRVLTEYRYIRKWENGFDSWKELHVSYDRMLINHWDIEHDIDYIFKLTDMCDVVIVELKVGMACSHFCNELYTVKAQKYVKTVMTCIKTLAESLSME